LVVRREGGQARDESCVHHSSPTPLDGYQSSWGRDTSRLHPREAVGFDHLAAEASARWPRAKTAATLWMAVMSSRGLPATARMSASLPASSVPVRSATPQ